MNPKPKRWLNRDKKKHSASTWNAHLKKNYGITAEEYNLLLEKQGGVCAICAEPCTSGKRLAVDHNHKTNIIRGLLCGKCNRGIGNFLDNTDLLLAAVEYLESK